MLAARAACDELLDQLTVWLRATPSPGVESLTALTLVFTWAETRSDLAAECLARAVEAIGPGDAGLFGGAAGLAWTLGRLADVDGADPCAPILDRLTRVLDDDAVVAGDLISGAVGFGVAALERAGTPAGDRLIDRILARLDAAAPAADPSLAHGDAGVVAWLARLDDPRARARLDGALDRLRTSAAAWPGRRLAWCRGDLGIACALWSAGREDEAIALARTEARRAEAEGGILDSSFCHGAVGAAHLLGRLAGASGDSVLHDAAARWYRRALTLARPAPDDLSLTTGLPGLALGLLAGVSELEPGWDRLFLVDLAAA